jgi:hypothetical protein
VTLTEVDQIDISVFLFILVSDILRLCVVT